MHCAVPGCAASPIRAGGWAPALETGLDRETGFGQGTISTCKASGDAMG